MLDPYLPKIHDPKPTYFPRQVGSYHRLFHIPPCAANTQIVAQRDPQTGDILGFIEAPIENAGSDARNSFSMQRQPGPQDQATRGSAANFPFWPGGFDEPNETIMDLVIDNSDFEDNLLSIAPGFLSGIDFSHLKKKKTSEEPESSNIDLLSIIESKDDDIFKIDQQHKTPVKNSTDLGIITLSSNVDESLLEIKSPTSLSDVLKIKDTRTQQTVAEWAEIIDISQPVKNFHQRVADMAHQYPFELDTFQKQAILKLEDHHHASYFNTKLSSDINQHISAGFRGCSHIRWQNGCC